MSSFCVFISLSCDGPAMCGHVRRGLTWLYDWLFLNVCTVLVFMGETETRNGLYCSVLVPRHFFPPPELYICDLLCFRGFHLGWGLGKELGRQCTVTIKSPAPGE